MAMDFSMKVLIVDDMRAMRSIVRGMLEEMGLMRIIEAEDGDSAWKIIQQSSLTPEDSLQLVIADWNMPGMSGVDLLRAVRGNASTRELPFLIITSEGTDMRISEAARAGATEFIMKPFHGTQLTEKLNAIFA